MADAQGRAVAFVLAPGQAHEAPLAPVLLDALIDSPLWVVGDRGLSSDALREQIWDMGARPVIPHKRNGRTAEPSDPVRCPGFIYVHRNRIEWLWGRLKEWRAVATRRKDGKHLHGCPMPSRRAGLAQGHDRKQALKP